MQSVACVKHDWPFTPFANEICCVQHDWPFAPFASDICCVQRAREEEIAERKAMKRAERDIARKKEYVRQVRLQIEEKRAEV